MNESAPRPTFVPRITYRDCRAAIEWLEQAFAFETTMLATDGDGRVVHARMRFGDGEINIGGEWENVKAPSSVDGVNTQNISVQLDGDIDAHCEHARTAGARIVQEPEDMFHGDRIYRAIDPQGHMWIFSQHLRVVSNEEMEAAVPGMKVSIRQ